MSTVRPQRLIRRFFKARRAYRKWLGEELHPINPVRMHPRTWEEFEVYDLVDRHDYAEEINKTGFTIAGHPVVISGKVRPWEFYFMPISVQEGPIRFVGGPQDGMILNLNAWQHEVYSEKLFTKHYYRLEMKTTDLGAVYFEYEYSHAENLMGQQKK